MTFDRIIAVVACAATVVCMVIAILSYFKKLKSKKKAAQSDTLSGFASITT